MSFLILFQKYIVPLLFQMISEFLLLDVIPAHTVVTGFGAIKRHYFNGLLHSRYWPIGDIVMEH